MQNNTVRFAHTADWHIRSSHLGVSRRGPDFTDAGLQVIAAAVANKCEFIIHAGDLLDSRQPTSENIQDLFRINNALVAAGIKMYCITGNHDMMEPTWTSVLEAMLDEKGIEKGIITADNQRMNISGLDILFLPYMSKEALLDTIKDKTGDILVWHGQVREFCGFPSDMAPTIEDFGKGWNLVLLGDIHIRRYETLGEGPETHTIGYPGATELVQRNDPLENSFEVFNMKTCEGKKSFMEGHYPVVLQTRMKLVYRVTSEEQMPQMLEEIAKNVDAGPMIFVRYNPSIDNFMGRLHTVADPSKVILRAEPVPSLSLPVSMTSKQVEDGKLQLRPFTELIPTYFPGNTELSLLAEKVCDPSAQPALLINQYVDARI